MTTVDNWLTGLAFAHAVGSGLIGGAFYAFSTFVMRALVRRPAAEGIAAMQSINVTVITPSFLGVFLGTAVVGVAAVALGTWARDHAGAAWLVASGLLYAVGTLGVTMAFNVPLNDNLLAPLDPADPSSAERWERYVRRWTAWNHVRTAAAVGAMASAIASLTR